MTESQVNLLTSTFFCSKMVSVPGKRYHIHQSSMATIRDVAKRAGVAPITVSRVVNNSGYVSEKTRARVEAAIADLGYVPNVLARSLRSRRTDTLALILTDISNPFWTTVSRGVEDAASDDRDAVAIIEDKLNAVGLNYEEFSGRYPSEFSGGQLQRISIARALLTDPTLLIADEPVSMVDASLRMSIVNLFKKLKDESGVSVLYITHDLATAYYVSDRIAIMFRGNIVEMGPVEKVLMEPKHSYTKLLRESVPEADPTRRWSERVSLSELEHEEYLRVGCKFAGRCPDATEICKTVVPADTWVEDVLVKCHKYTGKYP